MTEREIFEAVKASHDPQGWAVFPQVRSATGAAAARTADAIAVSLWPSRGIDVHGFEFKDSRADWQRELKDPAKAEAISRHCDYWWIVASKPGIAFPEELPPAWGLYQVGGGRLKVLKKAVLQDAAPPTWAFVAAVLRAARQASPEAALEAAVAKARQAGYTDGHKDGRQSEATRTREVQERYDSLAGRVREFETLAGESLSHWSAELQKKRPSQMAAAVKFAVAGGLGQFAEKLRWVATQADEIRGLAAATAHKLSLPEGATDEPGPTV